MIMLNKANALKDYKVNSLDGLIGQVKEFYFDEKYWVIHYLVADTGNWLNAGQVLISPYARITAVRDKKLIAVELTKKQIEDSPSLNSERPNPRQSEQVYYGYYGWPMYSSGFFIWGPHASVILDHEQWRNSTQGAKASDLHMHSTYGASGLKIEAADQDIGQVEDLIIDDETWVIRYIIINIRDCRLGKKILFSPQWIERVSWNESKAYVNLSRETIEQAPEYTEESLITRDYETALHRHYNRREYWVDEAVA
jgi:sporulation protein YlmC with PRC-barrel domain